MRLRRLCLLILVLRLFLSEPIRRFLCSPTVSLQEPAGRIDSEQRKSDDHLVQGILDDSFSAERFQFRNDIPHRFFVRDGFHRDPSFLGQV